jgi:PAS domain-containing protein
LEKAVTELKRSDSDLRTIVDTIPALVWCGLPDGSKEFLNMQWRGYTGLSVEESYGWYGRLQFILKTCRR